MAQRWPLVFGISGPSNCGKTTLIEDLLSRFKPLQIKIAVLKRHGHAMSLDQEGKDSDRFYRAGADSFLHDENQILYRTHERNYDLDQALFQLGGCYDLILVEGHKKALIPKIWLGDTCPLSNEHEVLAVLPSSEDRGEKAFGILRTWLEKAWHSLPLAIAVSTEQGKDTFCWQIDVAKSLSDRVVAVDPTGSKRNRWEDTTFCLSHSPDRKLPQEDFVTLFHWLEDCCWLLLDADCEVWPAKIQEFLRSQEMGIWSQYARNLGTLYYPQAYYHWQKCGRKL